MTQLSATTSEDLDLISRSRVLFKSKIQERDDTIETISRENKLLRAEVDLLWDLLLCDGEVG